jgi:uncharacterized delta-60 repeat protein
MVRVVALIALSLALPAAAATAAVPGHADRSFGRGGAATFTATAGDAVGGAVRATGGGGVLAGGGSAGRFEIVHLRRNGTFDRGFGRRGRVFPKLPGVSPDGVRGIAVFRDGRILAAGTLVVGGVARFAVVRLLPRGEVDPAFGGGAGYVLAGPPGATLTAMAMDAEGNLVLAGGRAAGGGAEVPVVVRLLFDGTPDPTFGASGTFDGAALGLSGRANAVLIGAGGSVAFTAGVARASLGASTFTAVRLTAAGAPDPTFAGTGVVSVALSPTSGLGLGADAIAPATGARLLVAGTDGPVGGGERAAVLRLLPNGALDPRFGRGGIVRIARRNDPMHVLAMTRMPRGRIALVGSARAPAGLAIRLRADGRRDRGFGADGLAFPVLGRPPDSPHRAYSELDAVDAARNRLVTAGSVAGAATLIRTPTGISYLGRFGFTVGRLR